MLAATVYNSDSSKIAMYSIYKYNIITQGKVICLTCANLRSVSYAHVISKQLNMQSHGPLHLYVA